jgi:diacylglycerol kinase (ATP)
MAKGVLVYNPVAGRYPAKLLAERAASLLREHGWELELEQTQSSDHITKLAQQSAARGVDGFFVTGGDGSVNLAVAGLVGSDTALGVLPAGTANVWAQELGLPYLTWTRWLALEDSANLLANAEIRSVDVGLCNGRPFLLWAGVGLDSYIVHRIEPRGRWEKHFAVLQYAASAAWNASFWQGIKLKVEVEGQHISGHYILAVVSNVHLYAGGAAILSPDARLDDGLMDLWLFEGESLLDTVQLMVDLFSGRHLQSEQVHRYPFKTMTLESESQVFLQLDGEPVKEDKKVQIEVKSCALKVMMPKQTPQPLFSESESS